MKRFAALIATLSLIAFGTAALADGAHCQHDKDGDCITTQHDAKPAFDPVDPMFLQ